MQPLKGAGNSSPGTGPEMFKSKQNKIFTAKHAPQTFELGVSLIFKVIIDLV